MRGTMQIQGRATVKLCANYRVKIIMRTDVIYAHLFSRDNNNLPIKSWLFPPTFKVEQITEAYIDYVNDLKHTK